MSRILVVDRGQALFDQVRRVMGSDAHEVVECSRVSALGEVLDNQDKPFDVVVAGQALATRAGMLRLAIIAQELPAISIVLAFGSRPEGSLREIVRIGAVDIIQLPCQDQPLQEALERAVSMALVAPEIQPGGPAPINSAKHGTIITVASATGGCGKTFFATNLGHFLKQWTGQSVCIVDIDLQFGEASTALRLRPKYTISDALESGEDVDDAALAGHIREFTVEHHSGVHVLAAPRDPAEADRISASDVTRILHAVRASFDYVIVDTAQGLAQSVLAALDSTDIIYMLATLDLPSIRNMSVFLGTIDRLRLPADRIRLVLNKAEADMGIDIDQVSRLFPQGFESVLPYSREVSRSINSGNPVLLTAPDSDVAKKLSAAMARLLSSTDRDGFDAKSRSVRGPGKLRRRSKRGS